MRLQCIYFLQNIKTFSIYKYNTEYRPKLNFRKQLKTHLKLLVQLMAFDLLDFCWNLFCLLFDSTSYSDWWSLFDVVYAQ